MKGLAELSDKWDPAEAKVHVARRRPRGLDGLAASLALLVLVGAAAPRGSSAPPRAPLPAWHAAAGNCWPISQPVTGRGMPGNRRPWLRWDAPHTGGCVPSRRTPCARRLSLWQLRAGPLDGYIAHFGVEAKVEVARLQLGDKGGGWGLRALGDIGPGEPFVALPRAAVIEMHDADGCPWRPDQLKAGVQRQDAAQVWHALPLYLRLALALVDVCRPSAPAAAAAPADGAAFREYLQILPQSHAGALSWSREDLVELQDAFMVQKVEAEQARLGAQYREICQALQEPPPEDSVRWALQTVLSRAFGFHCSGDGRLSFAPEQRVNMACLLPLVDSANHDPAIADTKVEYDEQASMFRLSSAGMHRKGEEVDISYGRKSNDVLLLNYGKVASAEGCGSVETKTDV